MYFDRVKLKPDGTCISQYVTLSSFLYYFLRLYIAFTKPSFSLVYFLKF